MTISWSRPCRRGELFLDLPDVPSGDGYALTTPRGVVQISAAGRYEIAAGDSATPTTVSVVSGGARIVSGSFSLGVGAGQTATVAGSDALQGAVGPLVRDGFLSAQLRRTAPPTGPREVRCMTGGESLGEYGSWQQDARYGDVWYPRVPGDWAPYRGGQLVLRGALGLDLDRQRAVGLRAVPLRALVAVRRALGLDAGTGAGAAGRL